MSMLEGQKIAVIVPAYRVRAFIPPVLAAIGPEVDAIYVVDDGCPEHTGRWVETECRDPRVRVIYHDVNQGVGGAVITGMQRAVAEGADVLVKIDGDGQHSPMYLPAFVSPILRGEADATKGNRFYRLEDLQEMPWVRIVGNAILSFMAKISTGYLHIFDPTNGYLALHALLFKELPADKLSKRFFFESDLLFRLYTLRAKIIEIPMPAVYGGIASNLQPARQILPFFFRHFVNTFKRIFYSYFLRNFSLASVYLILGAVFTCFGGILGLGTWWWYFHSEAGAPIGSVMLPALMIIIGVQTLLGFLAADVASVPNEVIYPRLAYTSLARKTPQVARNAGGEEGC